MRKIYISFLGLGQKKGDDLYAYNPASYHIDGNHASKSYEYVQSAEMDIIGGDYFDRVFIIVTPQSMKHHFEKLEKEIISLGVTEVTPISIENDLDTKSQWKWFEQVLASIDKGDELTIDLTHGYRIAPIIISTAINFLQKSKDIKLKHVWYGAYENNRDNTPVIDMKDFYIINEWADAVSRLVDDADARKLGEVAQKAPDFQLGNLGDFQMVKAFEDLTESVRNVEIHKIGEKASKALKLIEERREKVTSTGRILLDLVTDKFAALASGEPASGKYDLAYFKLQLEIIKILVEHKLFMQAYTVMRELIGSIGIIRVEKANTVNGDGRKQRRKAEVFVNMIQNEETEWKFAGGGADDVERLRPYYEHLKAIGVEKKLRAFCKKLVQYRNGFDHAWTSKSEASPEIEKNAGQFLKNLEEVVNMLDQDGIL